MIAICGWAGLASPPTKAVATLARMEQDSIASQYDSAVRSGGPFWGSVAFGDQVELYQEGDATVILAGRPLWRSQDAASAGSATAQRLLAGYRASGIKVLQSLRGAFALAISLDGGRKFVLAIDRMGITSLVYRPTGQGLLFGTSTELVNACLDNSPDINLQSVFNYIFLHMVPGPSTIFRDQFRIPPGGYIQLENGKIESGKYWQIHYEEPSSYDLGALKVEFRSLLERSVSDLLDGRSAGAFLSGGTDSSTVTGLLAKVGGKPPSTFSIGFQADGYDEVEYARIASRHFKTDHHEYYVTPDDVLALAPRLAAFCDQPFGNASAVPTYYCAKLARSAGVDLLLGGDGGDELFGGNDRYAVQAMFSWYSRIPGIVRRGLIEPILFHAPGVRQVTLLRKGRGYVTNASIPLPERLLAYNMLRRNPGEAVFTAEFLARIDPERPLELFRNVYHTADASASLNRLLAVDLQFTLADNDLYKVNKMCDLAGVDVAYPMLNDDLVAFSASLPTHLKLKGTRLRYFFKEALKDFLPAEVIAKHKHGFGLPIGIWIQTHAPLREMLYDAARAFGSRGIVRPEFIQRMISEHQSGHAAYWGGEIWVLSQLEMWLRTHGWAAARTLL